MLTVWITAARIVLKQIILYVGLTLLFALYFDISLLIKIFSTSNTENFLRLLVVLLLITSTPIVAFFVGQMVGVEKALKYVLIHYEPSLWAYILKYIKKKHPQGENFSQPQIQTYVQQISKNLSEFPWLARGIIRIFLTRFPIAEHLYTRLSQLGTTQFDEQKLAQEMAQEKDEAQEVNPKQFLLWLLLGFQTLCYFAFFYL